MSKLLALDPSMTATGWCLAADRPATVADWQHGTVREKTLADLALWYGTLLRDEKPEQIIYEEPLQVVMLYGKRSYFPSSGQSFATPNASQIILWKIEGLLVGLAAVAGIPILAIPVKTWRARVLGDGNLDRERAKDRAKATCQRARIPIRSVDEAEACCIALYGLSTTEWKFRKEIGAAKARGYTAG